MYCYILQCTATYVLQCWSFAQDWWSFNIRILHMHNIRMYVHVYPNWVQCRVDVSLFATVSAPTLQETVPSGLTSRNAVNGSRNQYLRSWLIHDIFLNPLSTFNQSCLNLALLLLLLLLLLNEVHCLFCSAALQANTTAGYGRCE